MTSMTSDFPMSSGLRLACVGTYVPRQCGIATFTHDLCAAITAEVGDEDTCQVIAINDETDGYDYPREVRFEVRQQELTEYRTAADFVNIHDADVLLVQHEFGIFGGNAGSHLFEILKHVAVPVVTTMHTVLREPNDLYWKTTKQLVAMSDRVVVMAEKAVKILRDVYDVPAEKIAAIPHGIPDTPFVDAAFYKDQFRVEGRTVLLTFGLLSPGKGIENAIRALPRIAEKNPNVIYIVLGATHPHLRKTQGEKYRYELQQLAQQLGVQDYIRFVDQYVELDELCEYLGVADIYLTPYQSEDQIVSGTLAYALGAGKAVVSTPYWYAQEMLAHERGQLVPFGDHEAIADKVNWLVDHEVQRQAMRKRAYLHTRHFLWKNVAESYLEIFREVRLNPNVRRDSSNGRATSPVPSTAGTPATMNHTLPALKLDHLYNLSDGVGILQHARYSIPDRDHGYCTDDNARGLIFALQAWKRTKSPELLRLAATYLSFLRHAYNEGLGRFRNFMSYDRRWLEEVGSEDSHGRAMWALGFAVAEAPNQGMRAAALDQFERALHATRTFESPRSWAFTIVGLHAYLRLYSGDTDVRRVRESLAEHLFGLYVENSTDEWVWPEERVTYANGKIPHALLLAGQWLQRADMVELGLNSLDWLLRLKTHPKGHVSLVGNEGWCNRNGHRAEFDQQPLEIHALVDACLQAYHVTAHDHWLGKARRCFDWFLGNNSVGRVLYDYETGGCRDGLEPSGVNENQGAESTLAWLLSLLAMHSLEDTTRMDASRPTCTESSRQRVADAAVGQS